MCDNCLCKKVFGIFELCNKILKLALLGSNFSEIPKISKHFEKIQIVQEERRQKWERVRTRVYLEESDLRII